MNLKKVINKPSNIYCNGYSILMIAYNNLLYYDGWNKSLRLGIKPKKKII